MAEDDEVTLEELERKYGTASGAQESEQEPKPEPDHLPESERYADTAYEGGHEGTGLGIKALRVVLWVATVVGGFTVARVFWDGLEAQSLHGGNSQRWFALSALTVLALGIFALLASYRGFDRRAGLMVPASLVAIVLAMLAFTVYNSRDNNNRLVGDYCSYGSRSRAQFIGCLQNVTPGEIVYSDTPAADFANGKRDDCGVGSGPYCGEAALGREAREALSEYERSP